MMTGISRVLAGFLIPCCAVLVYASQAPNSDFERELTAGKLAAEQGNYEAATAHFKSANQLRQQKCSACYVWLARFDMAGGKLDQALAETEDAVVSATTAQEQASAQLYRGLALGRQGNFAEAEAAFKAASAANPECLECRFNLGFVLLKESKDAEGVRVLKILVPRIYGHAQRP